MTQPAARAPLRYAAFALWTLGAPALAFLALAPKDANEAGPAMLVLLLSPALAGFVATRGLPTQPPGGPTLPAVGLAFGVMCAVITVSTLGAFAGGALVPTGSFVAAGALPGAITGLVTSSLEELGWGAGGITLARRAFGPRVGVLSLGVLWAAWHLVVAALAPPAVVLGMFGTEHPLAPARVVAFIVGCVAFRILVTALRDRSNNVWPAVAAHATGNVLLGALVGSGVARIDADGPWALFPGPTGLPFLLATAAAAALLLRRDDPPRSAA